MWRQKMTYDYVIVGGGLSGATLGYLLQQQGLNVIIFEKQPLESKEKLCGGIITTKTYNILINLFPQKEIKDLISNHFTSIFLKVNSISQRVDNIDFRVVKRKELDDYIINKYIEAGGKIIDKCKITEINIDNNYMVVNDNIIYYNYLIGADGCFSQVRKCLTGVNQSYILGFESFQKNLSIPISIPIVEFNSRQIGYNLIMPVKDTILLGSCDLTSSEQNINAYEQMVNSYGGQPNIRKGGFLPTGQEILLQKNNVYLVGDAAGLIHPLTGEGIYYALSSVIALYNYFIDDNKEVSYEKLLQQQLSTLMLQNKQIDFWKINITRNPDFCLILLKCGNKILEDRIQKILNQE